MKLRILGALCFSLIGSYLQAQAPQKVILPITKIYSIEKGFDDNDAVEVSVFGYLPDTCHKITKGSAKLNRLKNKVTVVVEGYIRQQEVCLEILTPFLEVIPVGSLKAGTYEIVSAENRRVAANLEVKLRSTDNRDDFLYAPVDTVELDRHNQGLTNATEVVLKGTYPHMLTGCMRIVDVKLSSTDKEVLVVQPIAQILKSEECKASDVDTYNRFTVKKDVDSLFSEKGLVHVRTLNGRALNKFVDFSAHN
jgi:hypothetical protein